MSNLFRECNTWTSAAESFAAPAVDNPAHPTSTPPPSERSRKAATRGLPGPARAVLTLASALALACLLGGCSAATETPGQLPEPPALSVEQPAEETPADTPEPLPATGDDTEATDTAETPGTADTPSSDSNPAEQTAAAADTPRYRDLPAYDGNPYLYVNDGEPTFTAEEQAAGAGTERYGDLDDLGRCTGAFAVVGTETMPTEERGSIGSVKPAGWQIAKYDFVDGKYLYNRCHLLGFQLTGENANTSNLITGTRYLNIDGMLPFENAVADYVHATGNHVLMRVTPVFEGSELVARGVHMMAESVEDDGDGVSFNVFCYNVQPGVVIDYATGDNMLADDATPLPQVSGAASEQGSTVESGKASERGTGASDSKNVAEYVLNTNSKKFHVPSCSSVDQMSAKNRQDVEDTRENIVANGYDPCKRCNP